MVVALVGLDQPAKVTIVFLGAVLPVAINGHAALRQIDGDYEEAALDLGATRLRALLAVVWPLALPQMVAGMRVGAGYALAACVVAEIYTAMTGLALIGIFTTALLRYVETFFARRAGLISERE
jgi:NitT/TauT family transport system permease protein